MVLKYEVIPSELLRSFMYIERTGSYTEAAMSLELSQPAISAQMKRLQQIVGGDLFERGVGGLRLTAKGETVKEYASRILNLNRQLVRLCGVGEKRWTFKVGIQNVFAPTHLTSLQVVLKSRFPDHDTVVTWGMGSELYDDLKAGYLDAAFVVRTSSGAEHVKDLWEERMCWVCGPNFVLGEGHPIPLISWPDSISDRLATTSLFQAGTAVSVVLVGHDLSTVIAGVRSGIGVCILPQRLVPPDLKIADFYYLPQLPMAVAGVYVNEGIRKADGLLLRDAIGDVMPPNAPFGPEAVSSRRKVVMI